MIAPVGMVFFVAAHRAHAAQEDVFLRNAQLCQKIPVDCSCVHEIFLSAVDYAVLAAVF